MVCRMFAKILLQILGKLKHGILGLHRSGWLITHHCTPAPAANHTEV